jgi:putative NADH-flavin reductase
LGTGLIVRDALAKGHSVVALVRSKARADLPGIDMIEGDARDEGTAEGFKPFKPQEEDRF